MLMPSKAEKRSEIHDHRRTHCSAALCFLFRRVFTVGSCIAAGGLAVLAIAYGGVWAVYHRALEIAFEYGMGFRSDMMYYARTMPMAAVFVLGGIMVMCGIVLAAYGLYKGGKHSRCGKKQENAR